MSSRAAADAGPRIVAVPGIGCDSELFGAVTGCTTVVPAGDTIDAMAGQVVPLLTSDTVLVGHSMGGYVAMLAAERVPTLRALVLVSTAASGDTDAVREARAALIDAARRDFPAVVRRLARRSVAADRPELVSRIEAMFMRTGPDTMMRQMRAVLHRPDVAAAATSLTVTTVVVGGAADAIIDARATAHLASIVPGAELIELDGCGHMPPMERPAALVDLLGRLASDE